MGGEVTIGIEIQYVQMYYQSITLCTVHVHRMPYADSDMPYPYVQIPLHTDTVGNSMGRESRKN